MSNSLMRNGVALARRAAKTGVLPTVPLHGQQKSGFRANRPLPLPLARTRNGSRCVHSVVVSVGRSGFDFRRSSDFSCSASNRFSSSCAAQTAGNKMPEGKPFERLPKSVRPIHYRLELVPDLKLLTFRGVVSIRIEVVQATDQIVLNALDLQLDSVTVKGDKELKPEVQLCAEEEVARFKFNTTLQPAEYDLDIIFKGEINDKMKGLYRSKYVNEKGEETYAAVTQFESTDARRCFPCWDEPALKATFDISLTVPKDLVALSNMPVKNSTPEGDLIRYDFQKTPIMSTYLVAAVIGEYDYVEDKSSDGVLVRVYTPKGKKEQGLFALEVATEVLPYYKDYFNIAYPLPKIDLIAIADFSAGAMENWGLVTYRETCLLVDPQNTSAVSKQWIALVVGHELAHQWFGNLVTMEWWTHLWLNEGYASFVEFLCVNYLFPEYDIWTQFVNDSYIKALELDSLKNSHPIEVPVNNPSEIDEIFDDISYNKGASVIRMLHHYIGDADFRKGMHLYLTRHQYKNTFTEDLWAALEEASNKPVGDVMSTWTKQMGFPVVTVEQKSCAEGGVTLSLSQSKFIADGSKPTEEYLWMIPISISTSKNPGKEAISTVLSTKQADVHIADVGPNDWIKINPGTIGFYRTQYPPEMLEKLIPAIRNKSLPPLDRLGLLDDLFAMVKAGHTSTVEVLKMLRAYEDETDYNVWSSISNILGKLGQLMSHTEFEDAYNQYQKNLLDKVYVRLGWNLKSGETHLDTLLRGLVLGRLAWLDHEHSTKEARERFEAHVKNESNLPADLRSACYKTVLRAGGKEEFDTLLKLYRSTDLHEEKDRISRALGAAKDVELLLKVLEFAMSAEVRSQDTVFVIISVALTRLGRELAWQFFKDNWSKIVERFSGYLLTRLVKYLTESFASEEKSREVEEFFKEHKSPGTERTVQQAIETIQLNTAWLKRDSEAIRKYLTS
ncbi:puromycin-sensitive aminopeptidase isoform X1 [Aethina tumida]|uniref:puromycin-sensitive aminopeptidase isoform X1 n=1 Tax=Aethina tumida TaxID=116153 RepID=UPI00214815F2|nr:puromycin-sensitive aminopeptidase isoform X1 [Aethina tumida]